MLSGGIEVWTARPEALSTGACAELAGLLDEHERSRAAGLRFEADRRDFVVAHALRRLALGTALGIDPQDIRFGSGPHGQPVLLGALAGAPFFSLTRTRGFVACALHPDGVVGIDAEGVRENLEKDLLDAYIEQLDDAADRPQDAAAFHAQWTALEAFWKARGTGLSAANPLIRLYPIDGCDAFEVVYGDSLQPAGFVAVQLPAPDGYVMSIVAQEIGDVRLVALDSLAFAPQTDPYKALSKCKNRHCVPMAAPNITS